MSDFRVLAFVSGKGGVGKTTLSTNAAWLLSRAEKSVMLVDLDLQNHGATGLFESQFDLTGSDVFALLRADDLSDVKVPANHVAPNLYMLPAFSGGRPAVVEAPFLSDVDEARRRLQ